MIHDPGSQSDLAGQPSRGPDVAAQAAPGPDVAAHAAPGPDVAAQAAPGPDVAAHAAPGLRPSKPRLLQDGRDMFWSMAPLVVACILLAGLAGMCSFQALGPTPGPIPHYDAAAALHADAAQLGFPVRLPQLPPGWQPNSGSRGNIDGARIAIVGYITPRGEYLSLTQSAADETLLVTSIHRDMYPAGTQDVNGTQWIVYQGGDGTEPVWTTRLAGPSGAAQIAITGAGNPAEFRTLAAATQSQPALT